MSQAGLPHDPKQSLFKTHFQKGLSFDEYLNTGDLKQQERWKSYQARIQLLPEQKELIESFTRQINILFISGIWCGDCVRQGPILQAIAAYNQKIRLHFIDNQTYPELRDEVMIQGGTRVPVALVLSEDYFEVARFGDRTLAAYRHKAERELGPACDTGRVLANDSELAEEIQEWLDVIERAYLILRLSPMLRTRYND